MADNNLQEYNELMACSVEDYLVRLKLYIDRIASQE